MDLIDAISTGTQVRESPAELVHVKLESLPPWKQLMVESRQLQTVADLLMEQSKRQIITAKRRITLLNMLRQRLIECSHMYMLVEPDTGS